MRYFTPGHNLTSRITAGLLVILYILTLGPLKEALAFVIPQNLLPAPISSSQITKFSSIAGQYDQVCRYNPTTKKFEYFVLDNPEYSKFTTLEPAKGYQVNLSSEWEFWESQLRVGILGTATITTIDNPFIFARNKGK